MKLLSVVGARPNFMKIAPLIGAISAYNETAKDKIDHILVHTGQHYDDKMSRAFFTALNIPDADINLGVGSGSHAEQVGKTMMAFEKVLISENPDWVIVLGDVNATLACSVTAKKLHYKVCHIEAGLRSHDEYMPEEINRLVTDRLSDLLLTPDELAIENLVKEGVAKSKIKFVGNIMIDTLEVNRPIADNLIVHDIIRENVVQEQKHVDLNDWHLPGNYALMTLHRPSNVDKKEILEPIINFLLDEVGEDMRIIWPIHPRTRKQLQRFGLWDRLILNDTMLLLDPLGYHEMLKLNMGAKIMLTDSGGLQEECTVLGTPCLTLRWNTERPITLRQNGGASVLVGNKIARIRDDYKKIVKLNRSPKRPKLWDGKTAERVLEAILKADK